MIIAKLNVENDSFYEQVTANTIDELLAKIRENHRMSNFEKEYFTSKGTLEKVIESGWYVTPESGWDEDRIDTIGQNGNEGLHYE